MTFARSASFLRFEFGFCCVGSCIGLMLVQVALGVMSVTPMCAIAILVLVQKLVPAKAAIDAPIAFAIGAFRNANRHRPIIASRTHLYDVSNKEAPPLACGLRAHLQRGARDATQSLFARMSSLPTPVGRARQRRTNHSQRRDGRRGDGARTSSTVDDVGSGERVLLAPTASEPFYDCARSATATPALYCVDRRQRRVLATAIAWSSLPQHERIERPCMHQYRTGYDVPRAFDSERSF
jgi:hypothetical protein